MKEEIEMHEVWDPCHHIASVDYIDRKNLTQRDKNIEKIVKFLVYIEILFRLGLLTIPHTLGRYVKKIGRCKKMFFWKLVYHFVKQHNKGLSVLKTYFEDLDFVSIR